jgi:hypothetical protein
MVSTIFEPKHCFYSLVPATGILVDAVGNMVDLNTAFYPANGPGVTGVASATGIFCKQQQDLNQVFAPRGQVFPGVIRDNLQCWYRFLMSDISHGYILVSLYDYVTNYYCYALNLYIDQTLPGYSAGVGKFVHTSNNYVENGNSLFRADGVNYNPTGYTIYASMRIITTNTSGNRLACFGMWDGDASVYCVIHTVNGNFGFRDTSFNFFDNILPQSAVSTTGFSKVWFVFDSLNTTQQVRVYVDGTLQTTTTGVSLGSVINQSIKVEVGTSIYGLGITQQSMDMYLSDFRVYSRVINANEMTSWV